MSHVLINIKIITAVLLLSVTSYLPATLVNAQTEVDLSSEVDATVSTPSAPAIKSAEFSNENDWHTKRGATFTWDLPTNVDSVAIELSTTTETEPEQVFTPALSEYVIEEDEISEGVQYLQVQFKNNDGWGEVASYRIAIDNSPPENFFVFVQESNEESDNPLLVFPAVDNLSGIETYHVLFDGTLYESFSAAEKFPSLTIDGREAGQYETVVIATDKAGNSTEVSGLVTIETAYDDFVDDEAQVSTTAIVFSLYPLLLLLLLGLFVWHMRSSAILEKQLLEETVDLKIQIAKIFSALKEEMHDQVQTISNKKRLSKDEEEAIKSMQQALKVSETLIEKEIDDVKQLLK